MNTTDIQKKSVANLLIGDLKWNALLRFHKLATMQEGDVRGVAIYNTISDAVEQADSTLQSVSIDDIISIDVDQEKKDAQQRFPKFTDKQIDDAFVSRLKSDTEKLLYAKFKETFTQWSFDNMLDK